MMDDIVCIGKDTYLVSGSNTNWVIVKDGDSCTLIDTGYPEDHAKLMASIEALGLTPQSVSAVLITHAHNDHIGSAERLRLSYGVPVLMHEEEVPHARRDYLDQVSIGQVLAQAWRPGVVPWAIHALRAGGKAHLPIFQPQGFPTAGPLDLPGAPTPLHTPGHTKGHCAYLLPNHGVLVTGDALVTGHPTSRRAGPQLLHNMFHGDRTQALGALNVLEHVEADVIAPGHGSVHHSTPREAVAVARASQ